VSTFWQAVLYLHLLAMAFFVGGQLVFGIAVAPILRADPDPDPERADARRRPPFRFMAR
jgi:putative copper export protein